MMPDIVRLRRPKSVRGCGLGCRWYRQGDVLTGNLGNNEEEICRKEKRNVFTPAHP
jgi:hypothetical protein